MSKMNSSEVAYSIPISNLGRGLEGALREDIITLGPASKVVGDEKMKEGDKCPKWVTISESQWSLYHSGCSR